MAIMLHDKYASEIQTKFVKESLISGRFTNDYSFSGGLQERGCRPLRHSQGDAGHRSGNDTHSGQVIRTDYR